MNVLVVGGAGYVGSQLTRLLWERGHDVTVLDLLLFGGESLLPLLGKPRFKLIPGDIRDRDTLEKTIPGHEAVCLFAAIVGETACNRDTEVAVQTNFHATRDIVEVSTEAGVDRLLFASTCSNYGVTGNGALVTEEAPLKPLSTYSESKVAAERHILAAATPTFHPTVLRLSTAFGISARMRFDLLVSDFTLAALRDQRITVYGEQFWRPFVHLSDIARAVDTVLTAKQAVVSGQVFNVGSTGSNVQKLQLAKKVQDQVDGTAVDFVRRDADPRSYRVDFSKVAERLGFQAKWSIDDGIREVHAALKAGVWTNPADPRYYN